MDENKKPVVALTDSERFPLLNDFDYLKQLRQDNYAPNFNFQSGDRLQSHHLQQVHKYANSIRSKTFWTENVQPAWLTQYIDWCITTVPFYQNRKATLNEQPTIGRRDLKREPWQFVSSDCNLEDLLIYQTSGTTGPPMDVIFDPVSQACWIAQLESVLEIYNIKITRGSKQTAIALICDQESTLTYASLSTYLLGAGVLKINLNQNDWRESHHRVSYLEKYNPEILTGDPFAFLSLLKLKPRLSPKALVSSAMKLSDGIRQELESYFRCPVLDIYSLTECRMVAVANGNGHQVIRPELYLEVFDPEKDLPLASGERGELVITGGNNPFLPLIRYRTGDFCSISFNERIPCLIDLEGRNPVTFYRQDDSFVNYIDISRSLSELPLAGFNVHQCADKSIEFTGWAINQNLSAAVLEKLRNIFGDGPSIHVILRPETISSKPISYTSDVLGAHNSK